MKKILLIIIFLMSITYVKADVLIDGYKRIPSCVKFENADSFPNVSIILQEYSIMGSENKRIILQGTGCITNSYKYPNYDIIATNTNYINKVGIDNIVFSNNENILHLNINIPAFNTITVPDTLPFTSNEKYYRIVGFTDKNVIIFLRKAVFKMENGKPDSLIIYSAPKIDNPVSNTIIYTAIDQIQKPKRTLIYPNPSQEELNFYISDSRMGKIDISISDLNGRELKTLTLQKTGLEVFNAIDISNFASGFYNLHYSLGDYSETRMFLKK